MTDKVQKIREVIEKRYEYWKEKEANSHSIESEIRMSECQHLLLMFDSLQEEPVSNPIDFEKELYKAFGQVKDFTLGMRIAKWFYDMGKNSQEPVSEDLEEAVNTYIGYPPEVDECSSVYDKRQAFKAGAKWQKKHLWKSANGDDLPEINRAVIVLCKNGRVAFGHRPYKGKYIGKNLTTGNIETFENETYDKGGWNIPDVKYWLDCYLPKEIEL